MDKMIRVLPNSSLEEKFFWLYIALVPFSGVAYFMLGNKRVGYYDFIILAALIIWLIKYSLGRIKFNWTALERPFIFMLVSFLFSFINSKNLFNSFVELSGLIYLIVLFILIINIISTPQRLHNLLTVFLIISTIISLAGLFYFCLFLFTGNIKNNPFLYYSTIESMAHHFPRVCLTFDSPNMMLTYLHVALIIGVILLLSAKSRKYKFFIIFSIVIILLAAFLTGSRRIVGLLLSSFLILSWFGKGKAVSFFKYATFLIFLLFLIASIITSIWVIFPVKIIKDELTKTITLRADYAYSLHLIQPVASINMFKKHPIIGVGLGTYNRNFKESVDWEWLRRSFGFQAYPNYLDAVQKRTLAFDPHSVFLGTLAETGTIGFLGLMYFFVKYAVLLAKRIKESEDSSRILGGCILAGFTGFLLNGLTIDILSMRHFWFMLAIGLAGTRLNEDSIKG